MPYAKNENQKWSEEAISSHSLGKNQTSIRVPQPHSDVKNHEAKTETP
jgi:hypothetical protein